MVYQKMCALIYRNAFPVPLTPMIFNSLNRATAKEIVIRGSKKPLIIILLTSSADNCSEISTKLASACNLISRRCLKCVWQISRKVLFTRNLRRKCSFPSFLFPA